MSEWTKFAERRPEGKGLFWFRIAGFKFSDTEISVEWVAETHFCGMGYGPNEWWPTFSHWDGYNRTVPAGTEWRAIEGSEKKGDTRYPGAEFLPCPHCGRAPLVEPSSRWITMPVYSAQEFAIHCRCRGSFGPRYTGISNAAAAWNRRTPLVAAAPDLLDALKLMMNDWTGVQSPPRKVIIARTALAKAEGREP